jgi:hypothetical protein
MKRARFLASSVPILKVPFFKYKTTQSPRDRVRIGSKDNPLPFLVGKTFKCRVDLVEIAHGCLTTTGTHVYRGGVSFHGLLHLFQWLVKAGSQPMDKILQIRLGFFNRNRY